VGKKTTKALDSALSAAKDELGGEIAIRAHIDKSGLTVGGKSRFLVATDRLLGGLMGIPASYVEGIRRSAEIREDARTEMTRSA
jgi:hypothetical protein